MLEAKYASFSIHKTIICNSHTSVCRPTKKTCLAGLHLPKPKPAKKATGLSTWVDISAPSRGKVKINARPRAALEASKKLAMFRVFVSRPGASNRRPGKARHEMGHGQPVAALSGVSAPRNCQQSLVEKASKAFRRKLNPETLTFMHQD